jgi:hypothetical protein
VTLERALTAAAYAWKCRQTLERATLALLLGPGYGPTERALAGSRWTERGNE